MQDEYERRKQLSFAQAEGAQPLPGQLLRKELSAELRAQLWFLIYESMKEARDLGSYGAYLERPWSDLMYVRHVLVEHLPADEFNNDFQELSDKLKSVLMKRDYVAVFDLIQWLLRRHSILGSWMASWNNAAPPIDC